MSHISPSTVFDFYSIYTYNAANQIASGSFAYDDNGNLTSDGSNSYTWDRANRLLIAPGSTAYKYDGAGNRIRQTVSSIVTDYLLDVQPGLAMVLRQTTGGNVDHFIHSSRGILAHQDDNGDWFYPTQDGLGSVRGMADDVAVVQGIQHYAPYGDPFGTQGSLGMPFGFTGEQTDANELVFLRARYLSPGFGTFLSLDPFEGMAEMPMSVNGYMFVEGDPINRVDRSGMCPRIWERGALDCFILARAMLPWGINVVWDYDAGDPYTCLNPMVQECLDENQDTRQRWTKNEMRAIYNAARIFRAAQSNIGFAPLNRMVTVEKRYEAGTRDTDERMALGLTDRDRDAIVLSARWWGEGERDHTYEGQDEPTLSINHYAKDPKQYRSWIVLHEMGHVYTTERNINLIALYERLIRDVPQFRTSGYFPTQYANNADPKEYMIEAITGVWWNHGYSTIPDYDSGAGGRTSPIDTKFDKKPLYFNTPNPSTADPNDTFTLAVINVASNIWKDIEASSTLQDWILTNIFSR